MRAELLDRYRSLALPTTRDEHWRFTNLEGFDPDAWTAEASAAAAVPSMLDLDVAATATIDEAGVHVSGCRWTASVFEPLTRRPPADRLARQARRQVPRPQRGRLAARAPRPRPCRVSSSRSRSTSASRAAFRAASLLWRVLVVAEPGSRFTLVQELTSATDELEAYVNGVVEVVVRDGAKAEIVNVQRLSSKAVAVRLVPRARRARRRARLGRGRLRLVARQGLDPERPRRPRRHLARHRRVLRRRVAAPRLRHVPAPRRRRTRRPTSRSRARSATRRRPSGAG